MEKEPQVGGQTGERGFRPLKRHPPWHRQRLAGKEFAAYILKLFTRTAKVKKMECEYE